MSDVCVVVCTDTATADVDSYLHTLSLHVALPISWSELVNFVDAFWKNSDVAVLTSTPASEEQRVKLFFSETGASYILGHADVSALARSEEHTSELQSLMRISSVVFCLKKKTHKLTDTHKSDHHTLQPSIHT